jgi:hypothetical protein
MDTTFQEGDTVQAKHTVQGMVAGQEYKVTDVMTKRYAYGTFVDYQLDGKVWVSNLHMLASKVQP